MKKRTKKTLSKIRIIGVLIVLFMLSGAGVMAVKTQVNTIKIILSDGYEMTVLTSKSQVADILKENNILLDKDEKVSPGIDENVTENGKIVISNKSKQEIEVAKISESDTKTTLDSLLQAYDKIVEKIESVEEEIPYETVKKDISKGAESTKNKVLQEGETGIKEVTYKVKYQNETEIERTKISEKVTKEPVEKIIQVKSNVTTSRSSSTIRKTSKQGNSSVKIFKVTAYCACPKCCGKFSSGRTASGTKATEGRTIATSGAYSFGTKLSINGKQYVVEDRGSAIQGNRIDVYMNSHSKALAWGVKYLPVEVIK